MDKIQYATSEKLSLNFKCILSVNSEVIAGYVVYMKNLYLVILSLDKYYYVESYVLMLKWLQCIVRRFGYGKVNALLFPWCFFLMLWISTDSFSLHCSVVLMEIMLSKSGSGLCIHTNHVF